MVTRAEKAHARRIQHHNRLVGEAQARMAVADDPVAVAVEALVLVDVLAPALPVGGGMALPARARPYAEAVIAALRSTAYLQEDPMPQSDPAAVGALPVDRPRPDAYQSARQTAQESLALVRSEIESLVEQRSLINDRVRRLRSEEAVLSSAMRAFDRIDHEPEPAPGSVRPSDDLDAEDAAVDKVAITPDAEEGDG